MIQDKNTEISLLALTEHVLFNTSLAVSLTILDQFQCLADSTLDGFLQYGYVHL